MNIQFIETKVTSLSLTRMSQDDLDKQEDFNFSFAPAFSEFNLTELLIIFDLSLKLENEFFLIVEYIAQFSTVSDIDEDFKTSHFVKGNAPAIAYPYLRAYIGNLTLNSGFAPAVLPTINFTQYLTKPILSHE